MDKLNEKDASVQSKTEVSSLGQTMQGWDFLFTETCHPISALLCPSSNKILNFCCSPSCKQNSILCGVTSCKCHKNHEECYNHFVSTKLIRYLENVEKSQMEMIQKVQKYFDTIIDNISQVREKVVQNLMKTINLRMGTNGMFWKSK